MGDGVPSIAIDFGTTNSSMAGFDPRTGRAEIIKNQGEDSGGAFNPAVAVGVSLMGLSSWANIWIFLIAELLGGVLAAYAFKAIHPPTDRPEMAVSESQSEQSRSIEDREDTQ